MVYLNTKKLLLFGASHLAFPVTLTVTGLKVWTSGSTVNQESSTDVAHGPQLQSQSLQDPLVAEGLRNRSNEGKDSQKYSHSAAVKEEFPDVGEDLEEGSGSDGSPHSNPDATTNTVSGNKGNFINTDSSTSSASTGKKQRKLSDPGYDAKDIAAKTKNKGIFSGKTGTAIKTLCGLAALASTPFCIDQAAQSNKDIRNIVNKGYEMVGIQAYPEIVSGSTHNVFASSNDGYINRDLLMKEDGTAPEKSLLDLTSDERDEMEMGSLNQEKVVSWDGMMKESSQRQDIVLPVDGEIHGMTKSEIAAAKSDDEDLDSPTPDMKMNTKTGKIYTKRDAQNDQDDYDMQKYDTPVTSGEGNDGGEYLKQHLKKGEYYTDGRKVVMGDISWEEPDLNEIPIEEGGWLYVDNYFPPVGPEEYGSYWKSRPSVIKREKEQNRKKELGVKKEKMEELKKKLAAGPKKIEVEPDRNDIPIDEGGHLYIEGYESPVDRSDYEYYWSTRTHVVRREMEKLEREMEMLPLKWKEEDKRMEEEKKIGKDKKGSDLFKSKFDVQSRMTVVTKDESAVGSTGDPVFLEGIDINGELVYRKSASNGGKYNYVNYRNPSKIEFVYKNGSICKEVTFAGIDSKGTLVFKRKIMAPGDGIRYGEKVKLGDYVYVYENGDPVPKGEMVELGGIPAEGPDGEDLELEGFDSKGTPVYKKLIKDDFDGENYDREKGEYVSVYKNGTPVPDEEYITDKHENENYNRRVEELEGRANLLMKEHVLEEKANLLMKKHVLEGKAKYLMRETILEEKGKHLMEQKIEEKAKHLMRESVLEENGKLLMEKKIREEKEEQELAERIHKMGIVDNFEPREPGPEGMEFSEEFAAAMESEDLARAMDRDIATELESKNLGDAMDRDIVMYLDSKALNSGNFLGTRGKNTKNAEETDFYAPASLDKSYAPALTSVERVFHGTPVVQDKVYYDDNPFENSKPDFKDTPEYQFMSATERKEYDLHDLSGKGPRICKFNKEEIERSGSAFVGYNYLFNQGPYPEITSIIAKLLVPNNLGRTALTSRKRDITLQSSGSGDYIFSEYDNDSSNSRLGPLGILSVPFGTENNKNLHPGGIGGEAFELSREHLEICGGYRFDSNELKRAESDGDLRDILERGLSYGDGKVSYRGNTKYIGGIKISDWVRMKKGSKLNHYLHSLEKNGGVGNLVEQPHELCNDELTRCMTSMFPTKIEVPEEIAVGLNSNAQNSEFTGIYQPADLSKVFTLHNSVSPVLLAYLLPNIDHSRPNQVPSNHRELAARAQVSLGSTLALLKLDRRLSTENNSIFARMIMDLGYSHEVDEIVGLEKQMQKMSLDGPGNAQVAAPAGTQLSQLQHKDLKDKIKEIQKSIDQIVTVSVERRENAIKQMLEDGKKVVVTTRNGEWINELLKDENYFGEMMDQMLSVSNGGKVDEAKQGGAIIDMIAVRAGAYASRNGNSKYYKGPFSSMPGVNFLLPFADKLTHLKEYFDLNTHEPGLKAGPRGGQEHHSNHLSTDHLIRSVMKECLGTSENLHFANKEGKMLMEKIWHEKGHSKTWLLVGEGIESEPLTSAGYTDKRKYWILEDAESGKTLNILQGVSPFEVEHHLVDENGEKEVGAQGSGDDHEGIMLSHGGNTATAITPRKGSGNGAMALIMQGVVGVTVREE